MADVDKGVARQRFLYMSYIGPFKHGPRQIALMTHAATYLAVLRLCLFVWEVFFFRYGVERHGQTDTTGPGTRMRVKGAGPKHAVKSGVGVFFVYPGDCIVLAWDARLLPTGRAREVQNELFLRLCIDNETSIDVRSTCWVCRAMSSR